MSEPLVFIGIDVGTSGARVMAVSASGEVLAEARSAMSQHGSNLRDPGIWWAAVCAALDDALPAVCGMNIQSICVDGTSGTLLALDADNQPLADCSMYNDTCTDDEILACIKRVAPAGSAVHGASSALARACVLQRDHAPEHIVHQADWVAGRLCDVFSSDDNNALKTGYDSLSRQWPHWIDDTGLNRQLLPRVNEPGTPIATLSDAMARRFSLPSTVSVIAGTTDGCASFLATGASQPGEGVTALGSTLTIKLLSDSPVFDADSGVYSHRIMGLWLAGGASNTGGNVLLAHFSQAQINEHSKQIDPESDSGLDYYPLVKPGERFPVADNQLAPRLTPVPEQPHLFLQGMLEGIAAIEVQAYRRLVELGAPPLRSVRSVGGGAVSATWTRLRARALQVPMEHPTSGEAAYGAALLARFGSESAQGRSITDLQATSNARTQVERRANPVSRLEHLDSLAEQYDAFLVDQFGVLLNGVGAYDYAADSLRRLSEMGKHIVLLSNSGKRTNLNVQRLLSLGFDRSSFDTVLSSGEVAHGYLKTLADSASLHDGKVLVFAEKPEQYLEGLPLSVASNPGEAQLILIAGKDPRFRQLEDYRSILTPLAERGVDCLCTNPDVVTLDRAGTHFGPGAVAELYESLGGTVQWIGKPYPMMYEAAQRRFGSVDARQIVCIGDSPAHDIAGAQGAGMRSALITQGIHADETLDAIDARCQRLGVQPDHVLERFTFSD